MCASGQPLCAGRRRSRSDSVIREGTSLGSQYAFCALGVGLVALGIVMILWSVVPADPTERTAHGSNEDTKQKTSSVAFVMVGAGVAMLLLAMCLGIRNRRNRRQRTSVATATQYAQGESAQPADSEEPGPSYDVPSYEEAVTSGRYPVRQSNLRQSTSQLPSYEDLVTAVETAPPQPVRSGSRASRLLRPLSVRRIKSEKLHVKDIRLNIQSSGEGGRVVIEPLTPPPSMRIKYQSSLQKPFDWPSAD